MVSYSGRDLNVIPAKRWLDGPPTPENGKILAVDMENVDKYLVELHQKECQHWGAPVEQSEPHVKARLRVEKSVGPVHPRPVFCDRECWNSWASSDRTRFVLSPLLTVQSMAVLVFPGANNGQLEVIEFR